MVGPRRLRLLVSPSVAAGRLLSSVEGSACGLVVVLEGAGSLLPRAPVSVEEDDCIPFLIGFPVIFM